jgi:hypothetical protein
MSQSILCPHCKGKLRVSASAGPRIRCHLCRKSFDNPAAVSVPVDLLFRPLVATPAGHDEPATTETAVIPAPEPEEVHESPPEPETPSVAVAAPRFAPDAMLSRTKRPASRRSKAARERLRARRRAKVKARDYGIAGFILFVIIGLIGAGGYMILRDDGVATRPGEEETPADVAQDTHGPLLSSALVDTPNKPAPARLLGVWELRTDDDRNGTMEFRADGTASFLAWVGEQGQLPTELHWAPVSETDDELTIELGDRTGAPGVYRFRLLFTSPDAFTITWKIERGIERDTANRFIRRASAAEPQPQPVTP